jgi:hypothetical protein
VRSVSGIGLDPTPGEQKFVSRVGAWVLTKFYENLIDTYPSFPQRNTTEFSQRKTKHNRRNLLLHQELHSRVCVEWFGSVAQLPKFPHPCAGVTGATI